ncbi:MAG: hypothetical protein AB7O65_13110 [Candidatus Korobacteraceae bacterium]
MEFLTDAPQVLEAEIPLTGAGLAHSHVLLQLERLGGESGIVPYIVGPAVNPCAGLEASDKELCDQLRNFAPYGSGGTPPANLARASGVVTALPNRSSLKTPALPALEESPNGLRSRGPFPAPLRCCNPVRPLYDRQMPSSREGAVINLFCPVQGWNLTPDGVQP